MRDSDVDPDYDRRQYQRMLDLIVAYQAGTIGFPTLVDNLDALHQVLNNPSTSWVEQFEHLWGILEEVHAVMLDARETQFHVFQKQLVDRSLADLVPLIKREMDSISGVNE